MIRLLIPSLLSPRTRAIIMPKRARPHSNSPVPGGAAAEHNTKKPRTDEAKTVHRKIATAEAAARVDAAPPFKLFKDALMAGPSKVKKGDAVVYWHRMEDLRIYDNRALSQASRRAKELGVPLLVLFVISPDDYEAHDRSPRRIDFTLRNLMNLKELYAELHIPLQVITHKPRRTLPERVLSFLDETNASHIYANQEYAIDELRRDIRICTLATDKSIQSIFVHDKLVVEPGTVLTQQDKPYSVYSPFQRNWLSKLNANLHWLDEAPGPTANNASIHKNPTFKALFDCVIPDHVDGFECADHETMEVLWPEGTDRAKEILQRFLKTKSRAAQLGPADPLTPGAEESDKHSRLAAYADGRNRADRDTSSRMSPYLAAGVIPARACIREAMKMSGKKGGKVDGGKDSGVGFWVQEIAWRDFYTNVLVSFPRVSMGRPYNEKFANVKWEVNDEHLDKWKQGMTGVPIVDASMRALNSMGWLHNRCRMIVAMYLVKDLMIDWRLGEKYFMEQCIDGELASNDGGWQWSASTGCDPQPYFRIFNPYSQSMKADPTGDFIRSFVPELASLRGDDLHNPSPKVVDELGYPRPLVDHSEARQRALARYKNPGSG